MTLPASEIKPLMLCFLKQQQEIYGNELFVSDPELKRLLFSNSSFQSLEECQDQILSCRECVLHETRNKIVFGSGNPKAPLLIIGEAPGEDEDRQGKPFVGKAGQLLEKMLLAIDFNRDETYITNILKCRPPENRDPHPDEIECCAFWLSEQIRLIKPKMILALGRISAQTLTNTSLPLNQLREKNLSFQNIPVHVTFHPAALLRNPEWKHPAWKDIQNLRHAYDRIVGDKGKWKPTGKI